MLSIKKFPPILAVIITVMMAAAACGGCGQESEPRDTDAEAPRQQSTSSPELISEEVESPESDEEEPSQPDIATLVAEAVADEEMEIEEEGVMDQDPGRESRIIPTLPSNLEFITIEDPSETGRPEDLLAYSAAFHEGNLVLKYKFVGPLDEITAVDHSLDPGSSEIDFRSYPVFVTNYLNTASGPQLRILLLENGYVDLDIDDNYDGMTDRDLASYYWYILNDQEILTLIPEDLIDMHGAQGWVVKGMGSEKDTLPDRYNVEKYRLMLP